MFSEATLAALTKVAIVGVGLFVVVPGAIWAVVRYLEFLSRVT